MSCTSAEDFCGHIGDLNKAKYAANKNERFYLDKDNPACCTGNITSWRVCYYSPSSQSDKQYTVKYAVYRRNGSGTGYLQVSNINFDTTLTFRPRNNDRRKRHHDRQSEYQTLNCHDESLTTPFTVHAGDVIGACVFNPSGGDKKQLNIVSNVAGNSHNLRLYMARSCRNGDSLNFPSVIMTSELSAVNSMRLHISANISKFVPSCMIGKPSLPEFSLNSMHLSMIHVSSIPLNLDRLYYECPHSEGASIDLLNPPLAAAIPLVPLATLWPGQLKGGGT